MPRNIELKARLEDLAAARAIAGQVATEHLGRFRQVDTYFRCRTGRLKLREVSGQAAELIWYERPDSLGPKASDYRVSPVADAASLKATLTPALGVLGVVDKQRELFLCENVRIHLDDVARLGTFLEFEAALEPDEDDRRGREQVEHLAEAFRLDNSNLVSASYSDLVGIE